MEPAPAREPEAEEEDQPPLFRRHSSQNMTLMFQEAQAEQDGRAGPRSRPSFRMPTLPTRPVAAAAPLLLGHLQSRNTHRPGYAPGPFQRASHPLQMALRRSILRLPLAATCSAGTRTVLHPADTTAGPVQLRRHASVELLLQKGATSCRCTWPTTFTSCIRWPRGGTLPSLFT